MFTYALFDLDGTLTDPRVGITTCVQYSLHSFGIEEKAEKLTPFIGPPLKDSFMEFYGFSEEQAQQAISKYRERFSTIGLFENEIYPGIEQMLQILHKKGMKLAVASSKPTIYVKKILAHFNIEQYFDVVVGSELDGRRTDKQEVVSEALHQLGVTDTNRNQCVMIGDRKFDIIGAKAAHVNSVGVAFGYAQEGELEQENPDFIAASVAELQNYLLLDKAIINDKSSSLKHAFSVILPILIYFFIVNFIIFFFAFIIQYFSLNGGETAELSSFFAKHSQQTSVIIQFIAMGTGAAVLIPSFLREKPVLYDKETNIVSLIIIMILGICAALFFNVLFSLTGFTGSSQTYKEVADSQFSFNVVCGLLLYGILSPLTEEIVFRGIVYNRLRRYFPLGVSIFMSGILFGVYHGNIVQAAYGFLLGLIITWAYESFGSFLVPVLVHAAANMAVYIVINIPVLNHNLFNWTTCISLGVLTMLSFIMIKRNKK